MRPSSMLFAAGVAAVLAGVVAALASGGSVTEAATPSTEYDVTRLEAPHPQERGRWGERLHAAGDLDGDGVSDFFVVALQEDVAGVENAGRVYLLSGRDFSVIYEIDSPEIQAGAQFGFFIQAFGDVTGDGRSDIAVGTDAQDVYVGPGPGCGEGEPNDCNENQGKAWVFDGGTGGLLYSLDNPDPQSSARFGSRIGSAGDVTGDGRPDLIVGASNNDVPANCGASSPVPDGCRVNQGQAYIFNGVTGALVRRLELPDPNRPAGTCTSSCGSFGLAVQSPGDTNGDGVPDQLVDAGSYSFDTTGTGTACQSPPAAEPNGCNEGQGRMYIFSGADGTLLQRIDDPEPQAGAVFGFQDAEPNSPGDVNGDGLADVYGNGFLQDGPAGEGQGRAWVFNGNTGAVLYEVEDPTPEPGGQFAFSLSRTDYNKDGVPDLYVGQSPHHVEGTPESGGTYVFNGRDGSLLKPFELPASDAQPSSATNGGPRLGWSNTTPGDLNRDGEPDFIAGAPFYDVGANQDQGRVYVFLSRVPGAPSGPTGPTGPTSLADCPPATTVFNGTEGNDTINGSPGDDLIFAGTGDDVVDGLAGDDCLDLGPGEDRGQGGLGDDLVAGGMGPDLVSGSSGNDRLSGDSGDDRLVGGTGNDRLRAGTGRDRLFGNFGNDRLHGQTGADRIAGNRGRDRINGGRQNDRISGGSSPDVLNGDAGDDRLDGGSSADRLRGNSGNDRLIGGTGRDRLSGGSGNDRIRAADGRRDRVNCGRGRDVVRADALDLIAPNCEVVRRR